jgi:tetratricopeptide (TPR) repeat protein
MAEIRQSSSLANRQFAVQISHVEVNFRHSAVVSESPSSGEDPNTKPNLTLWDQFLRRKSKEFGLTIEDLRSALEKWSRTPEGFHQKGLVSLFRGDYEAAAVAFSAAIESKDESTLTNYFLRANAEYELDEIGHAESDLRKVYVAHPDNPAVLNNLAAVLFVRARQAKLRSEADTIRSEGVNLVRRGLVIDEKLFGPDSPEVSIDRFNLAQFLMLMRETKEAEGIFESILANDANTAANHDLRWAEIVSNLTVIYLDDLRLSKPGSESKIRKMEIPLEEALRITKAETTDSMVIATLESSLSSVYKMELKYRQAEELLRKSLDVYAVHFGKDSFRLAPGVEGLADICAAQQKYEEAKALYERALTLAKNGFEPDAPFIAEVEEKLAGALRRLGREAEARAYEEQALKIRHRNKK